MQDEGDESRYLDHVLATDELRRSKPNRLAFTSLPRNPVTVVLDGVTGNYNLGAIFRLCDAFMVGPGGRRRAALGAVARGERRRGGCSRGEGSGTVDRGRRTQRGEREPGSVAAAIPGGPCPGLRVFRCVERRARLRRPGGRNTHVGDGQLVECRHRRRDSPVRTDTAMRSQMTRCKADSPFSPTTQIGPTIPDSAGFQPSTGRPTESGRGAPPPSPPYRVGSGREAQLVTEQLPREP